MVANYNFISRFPGSGILPSNLTDADSLLYFSQAGSLWQSDGTGEGTRKLMEQEILDLDNLGFSAGNNGKFFFNASDNTTGFEPWISDGTTEGTKILKDINPNGSSNPTNFSAFGNRVIFTASSDSTSTAKLWTSDGTREGTHAINLIAADGTQLHPVSFADRNLGDSLYFTTQGEGNASLWQTNGTQAGTERVFDLTTMGQTSGIDNITVVGDQLCCYAELNRLFFTTSTSDQTEALWTSDGTTTGTSVVVEGLEIDNGDGQGELIGVGDHLFFTADDGTTGVELWKSDGTNSGTTLVKDITVGAGSSSIQDLTVVDETLYFIHNSELWQSDGTENGTFRIQPGSFRSGFVQEEFFDVEELSEFNDQLYFAAKTPDSPSGNSAPTLLLLSLEDINEPVGSPVYRLFNPERGVHLYTIDEIERDSLIDAGYQPEGEPDNFIFPDFEYQRPSFTAVLPTTVGSEAVYRFFNETTQSYLYTTDEGERDYIQDNLRDFAAQGIAFNAYATQIEGSIPIYRFYEPNIGTHFFTPNEVEKEFVEANLPNYNFEGIAYYGLPEDATFIN